MKKILGIGLLVLLLASCANRGAGPQGGPKDTIPPVVRQCEPAQGTLNFSAKKIEITFDEYIQLDNLGANLLMSPPQQNPPEVKARGKKVTIQFQDTLYPNTTYTIDFGAAICDYREKVPLRGFSYYFATGDEIDTLETSGYIYDALTLNPMHGITVGIYANMADSAFERLPFLRIAKTDSAGMFRIKNIHQGRYRLYAVEDMSRDYRLTIGEAMAFMDTVITVEAAAPVAMDSTASDSIAPQVPEVQHKLFLFKEAQKKLYFQRAKREEQHRIQFSFSATPDSLPQIRPLSDSLHYHVAYSAQRDTVSIWLTDSMSIKQDSLFFEVRYRMTDSLYNLVWSTDTIRAIWRAPRLTAKAQEAKERAARNRRLTLSCNARKGFDIYDTLTLRCTTPLASIADTAIRLYEKRDTNRIALPYTMVPYDTMPMAIQFLAELQPEGNYELLLDSGALHDVYGITHIAANYGLTVKALTDYSTLRVKIMPYDPQARIQLMNNKDEVLRELPASEEGALFEYLKPDGYYLRLYIDRNHDQQWTTGNWSLKRQPEPIYYFPEKIQTKSNWDFEEEWDYTAIEQTQSKPKELIKVGSTKK
ncbi:MAG: Ig-like domain-containing protein [Paludibacteraceae bacterium]|nr:Ig-like domain-containing protein [Paludibacteraceae bacterium]